MAIQLGPLGRTGFRFACFTDRTNILDVDWPAYVAKLTALGHRFPNQHNGSDAARQDRVAAAADRR